MRDRNTRNVIQFGGSSRRTPNPSSETVNQVAGDIHPPTLKLLGYVTEASDISSTLMEFHMTIRPKVSELIPKAASLLLAVANWRAVHGGVDFTLYMAMEYLYSKLRKSGWDTLWIREEKVRQTVLLAELILATLRGTWLNFAEREELPDDLKDEIVATGWLVNERTMHSWKQHWVLERYLEVKIVPVENILKRDKLSSAERYTAYTRGYGQDGNAPSPGKTRPSAELDGEPITDKPPPSFTLQEFDTYVNIINSIESAKAAKRAKQ